MTNITINKKTFEKEIGNIDEKMENKIMMFGTEIEKITEEEIVLEITPDRPDLLSYQGFKRSFLNFLGKEKQIKRYKINKPGKDYKVFIEKSVKSVRPWTVCAIVKGLDLNDEKIKELIEIQEKLHLTLGRKRKKVAIGIYPLEKIKLPITYTAKEPDKIKFIPLESEKEMSGLEILQRHPTGREYAPLLAGKTKFPVFIDANKKILSMPPIINSKLTGKITLSTKDVFVECSGYNLDVLKKCLNIIATCLADIGGNIYQMTIISKSEKGKKKKQLTPDLKPEKNILSVKNANKLLGLDLNEKNIKELLQKMGHSCTIKKKNENGKMEIESPSWRTDILHEVDLIEDIAIAYGYEKFIPEIPDISTIGEELIDERIKRKLSEILAGIGFIELSNYHLTSIENQLKKMSLSEKSLNLSIQKRDFIEVEESKTEYNILRKDLTHYLLQILSENIDSEYPQKIFEIGKTFKLGKNKNILEKENLSLALSPGNYTEIRQVLEYLLRMAGLEEKVKINEPLKADDLPIHFIEGRTAVISLAEKNIGFIGEIHPKILKNWRIKMPVALLEISLEEMLEKFRIIKGSYF